MGKPRKRPATLAFRVEKLEEIAYTLMGIYKYVAKDLEAMSKRLERLEGVKEKPENVSSRLKDDEMDP